MFFPLLSWSDYVLFASWIIKDFVLFKGKFAAVSTVASSCLYILKMFFSFSHYFDIELYWIILSLSYFRTLSEFLSLSDLAQAVTHDLYLGDVHCK